MVVRRQRGQQQPAQLLFPLEPVPGPVTHAPTSGIPQEAEPRPIEKSQANKAAGSGMESGGLYIISVAARMLEMHPQTLRKYERFGLINPPRTVGMLRLYSQQDIERLRVIKRLVDGLGVNLAGVELVLSMVSRLSEAKEHLQRLEVADQVKEMVGKDLDNMLQVLNVVFDDMLGQ